MTHPRQDSIARVRSTEGGPVIGAGFLVSPRHVMTCAHVVNEALGVRWEADKYPTESVWIEFPFAQAGINLGTRARVVRWSPPGNRPGADVAVLELEREHNIVPYRTASAPPKPNQNFRTMGFPEGHDWGMPAEGKIETANQYGVVVQEERVTGFFIEGGFSGAPLLHREEGTVLGMAALADSDPRRRVAIIVPAEQLEPVWPPLARPYKGLSPFDEDDARFFFGRKDVTDQLAQKIEQRSRVAVVGRSGSGKSSLVQAGLIPLLRRQGDWCVVKFRPGWPSPDPFRNLAAAMIEAISGTKPDFGEAFRREQDGLAKSLQEDPFRLTEHLQRCSRRKLLAVDSFEELFTVLEDRDENEFGRSRARFVKSLLNATSTKSRREPAARFVINVRTEYMEQVVGLANELDDPEMVFELRPMTTDELRQAIVEPARSIRVEPDDRFVSELLRAAAGSRERDILPPLQLTVTRRWSELCEVLSKRGALLSDKGPVALASWTTAEPEQLLSEAVTQHAEWVFDEMVRLFGERTVRKVLVSLVWLDDRKRQSRGARGCEYTRRTRRRSEFNDREWELVDQLASEGRKARLVVTGKDPEGELTVELITDFITRWRRLCDWLMQDQDFLLWLQKTEEQAEDWKHNKRDASDLLRGRRLTEAQEWRRERADDLRSLVSEYIAASELHRVAALKRRTKFAAGFAAFALVLALWAVWERELAQEQRNLALAERERAEEQRNFALMAQAAGLAGAADRETARGDATTGLLLALQPLVRAQEDANPRGMTAEAERAAYDALLQLRELRVLRGYEGSVTSVAFSPDGQHVATGSQEGTARVWDLDREGDPKVLRGGSEPVVALAFWLHGDRLAIGFQDGTARVWDFKTPDEPIVVRPPQGGSRVTSLAFSGDGERLATGAENGVVQVWDLEKQVLDFESEVLSGRGSQIRAVAFSPDGERVAAGAEDGTARLWDVRGGPETQLLEPHEGGITSVAFSPDGNRLAMGAQNGQAWLWNLEGGSAPGREPKSIGHDGWILAIAFSPDGKRVATASADGTARLWDATTGNRLAVLGGHDDEVLAIAFSPCGDRLATASWDGTARLWDKDGHGLAVLRGHEGRRGIEASRPPDESSRPVLAIAFSPRDCNDAGSLTMDRLVTGSADGTARLWDARDGRGPSHLYDHGEAVTSVTFARDGKRLATGSLDRTAQVFELKGGRELKPFEHGGAVTSVAFSPDGKSLATGSWDRKAHIWDVENGRDQIVGEHNGLVTSVAFSPDGKSLATGSWYRKYDQVREHDQIRAVVQLWPIEGGPGHILGECDGSVTSIAFSPDGKRVAAGSSDRKARVWHLEGEPAPDVLGEHEGSVTSVAFSPDGKSLATGAEDGTTPDGKPLPGKARIWDLEGRHVRKELDDHRGSVTSVAFSPDGKSLATGFQDGTAWLWDAESGRRLAMLRGHGGPVTSVAFSPPDGSQIATGSQDRSVRLWDAYSSREALIRAAAGHLPRCLSPAQLVAAGLLAYPLGSTELRAKDLGDTRQPHCQDLIKAR